MTTREEWLALAERCAKAEGPRIGLDLDIGLAAGFSVSLALPYTASLDAITGLIALALPGWHWVAEADGSCSLERPRPAYGVHGDFSAQAASTPLALCMAFCRAMAEKAK